MKRFRENQINGVTSFFQTIYLNEMEKRKEF